MKKLISLLMILVFLSPCKAQQNLPYYPDLDTVLKFKYPPIIPFTDTAKFTFDTTGLSSDSFGIYKSGLHINYTDTTSYFITLPKPDTIACIVRRLWAGGN